MPEYYLDMYPVGHERIFLVGRTPDDEHFEQELTPEQIRMVSAFTAAQDRALQNFLLGLVT